MEINDWITLGSAVTALCTAIWALVYNRATVRTGKVSADAAVRSADAAVRSADAADASAAASARSAEEAAAVSRIERDREHAALRPPPPAEITGELSGEGPRQSLFGEFVVPRDYRVHAVAWNGTSHTPISLPLLVRANQVNRFCIESWPQGRKQPQTREIEFEFWPPAETDGVEAWACPCDRPHSEKEGHWRWRVPLSYTDVLDTIG